MEILNIGPFEFVLILLIALLLLGPKGMVAFMRQIGSLIRKIVVSPIWKDIMSTSKEIRDLPQKFVREADLEKEFQEFQAWRAQTRGLGRDLDEEIRSLDDELRIHPPHIGNDSAQPDNTQPPEEGIDHEDDQKTDIQGDNTSQ